MLISWKKSTQLSDSFTCDIHSNFTRRALCRLHHTFIPHDHNDNYPHGFRPKALLSYTAALVAVKLIATGILFISFPNPGFVSQEIISKVFTLTNQSRAEEGLEPLVLNSALIESAQLKADDMIEKGYFSHYTPEGNPPWFFIDENKYSYEVAGENLAMNFTAANTVHKAFLASPSHKKNILDSRFEEVGFAIANGEIEGKQTQVLVEFFGKPQAPLPTPTPAAIARVEDPIPTTDSIDELPLPQAFAITVPANVEGISTPEDSFEYSEELLVFSTEEDYTSLPIMIYRWSNYLFTFFIAFLTISLFINTIMRMHIQHGRLVVQTLLVILLITGLLYIRIHFLEGIPLELSIN